jgi:pilus assembly protein CpaB
VDVLVDLPIKSATEHFSKTILHDISILSTGQIWEQKGDSKPMVVNTVTLELTPEQAEVLNLASNEGKIRLALRNRNNKTIAQTTGVTSSFLIGGAATKPEKVLDQPFRAERSVEVIKGLDRSEAKL